MRRLFFLLMTISGIIACQNNAGENAGKRSLNCYIRILEAEGRIRAEATMQSLDPGQKEGTTRPVQIPDGILYQGASMNVIPGQGLTYMKDFPGEFVEDHMFTWKEAGQKQPDILRVKMNNIKNFGFGSKTISSSKPANFTWETKGLERGESLVLMWENTKENLTVPMEVYIHGSAPSIAIPATKMKELKPGTWTLYTVRKKLTRSEIGKVTTQAIMEFYSKTDTITVTP